MSSIAGNTSTTSVLSVGETETHSITAAGDADWLRVTLTAGLAYSFTVVSSGGPGIGLPDPDMGIYDSFGNEVISQTLFSTTVNLINLRPLTSGSYYIGVGDNGGDIGQYAVSWVATDTIVNNTSTTANLVVNGSVTSKIDVALDSDWFNLSMTAGLSYGFEAKSNGVGGLPDADIILRDAAGNQIASSTIFSATINLLSHNAMQSGQYFIDISDNGGDSTGGYAARFIATDTIKNNITTTNVLGALGVVTSAVDVAGDTDWFKVTLVEGRNYAFQISASGVSGLPDGDLFLLDAGGNQVASATNFSSSTNTLSYTAAASGVYFINVGDTGGVETGGYTLRNVGSDTVLGNLNTTSRLNNGMQITGTVDNAGDADWHRFEANQGQTYTFKLTGNGTATELAQTRLILRDAAGSQIQFVTGETGTLTYIATVDGPVYLDVQGLNSTYSGRYYLSVVSDDPTLLGTALNDRITGGLGNTTITGDAGNDWIDGGAGADRIFGSAGNDTVTGNSDNDRLYGGSGADSLSGGSGADVLEGDAGNDILRGGSGADTFTFRTTSNADTIVDFQDGSDIIRILGGPANIAGLTLTQSNEDVLVGFGTVSIRVNLITVAELTSADFLFV